MWLPVSLSALFFSVAILFLITTVDSSKFCTLYGIKYQPMINTDMQVLTGFRMLVRSSYIKPTILRNFSSYRDIGKPRLQKTHHHCESSQKFHGNKIRTSFSAFRGEKQKRTTAEVRTRYANEFVIYCDACRGGTYLWLSALRQSCVNEKIIEYYWKSRYTLTDILWMKQSISPKLTHTPFGVRERYKFVHSRCSAGHSRCSAGHSRCSAGHSRCSAGHSRCSAVHSRCSAVHSRCSAVHSRCSAVHSRCSAVHSRCSAVHSRCSAVHSRCSVGHSRCSVVHSRCSVGHSEHVLMESFHKNPADLL